MLDSPRRKSHTRESRASVLDGRDAARYPWNRKGRSSCPVNPFAI